MTPLQQLFPNLGYIGGAVGRELDLWVGRTARYLRFSLAGRGQLSLERVVVYGRRDGKLVNLALEGAAQQSSADGIADTPGPDAGLNGIVTGYDCFATGLEDNPWWILDLKAEYPLETIHVCNNGLWTLSGFANALVIETKSEAGDWTVLYDRQSDTCLADEFKLVLATLAEAKTLPVSTSAQGTAKHNVLCLPAILSAIQAANLDGACIRRGAADTLLTAVEQFLPATLAHDGAPISLTLGLSAVRKLRCKYPACENVPPQWTLFAGQEESGELHEPIVLVGSEVSVPVGLILRRVTVLLPAGPQAHLANTVEISTGGHDSNWHTHYAPATVVRLCQRLAWIAFQLGDDSARCIALNAIPALMLREERSLQPAYLWLRLNLPYRSPEFRQEVLHRVSQATRFDFPATRLAFGRHGFCTPLKFKNQTAYVSVLAECLRDVAHLGLQGMILYGTLLGTIRDNQLIPHDDDVDAGYLLDATDWQDVVAARETLRCNLEDKGWLISDEIANRHLTFSVGRVVGGELYWIELFPIWRAPNAVDRMMYMARMLPQPVPATVIGNGENRVSLYGQQLPAPTEPESFLSLRYGDNWRAPDPLFEI